VTINSKKRAVFLWNNKLTLLSLKIENIFLITYKQNMEGNISEAIKLMFIGLTTVFAVLILVILLGNLLIRMVNKYGPEEEKPVAKQSNIGTINPIVAQAIKAAVNTITGGKGAVTNIEKL